MSILRVIVATFVLALAGAAPAHAVPGWTTLHNNGTDGLLLACKIPESGGYGPVWKVHLVLTSSQTGRHTNARVDVVRGNTLIGRRLMNTWWGGAWDQDITYASRLFGDRLVGGHGFSDSRGAAGGNFDVTMPNVVLC